MKVSFFYIKEKDTREGFKLFVIKNKNKNKFEKKKT